MLVCIIVWIDSGNKYKKETLDETKPKSRANRVRQSPDFVLFVLGVEGSGTRCGNGSNFRAVLGPVGLSIPRTAPTIPSVPNCIPAILLEMQSVKVSLPHADGAVLVAWALNLKLDLSAPRAPEFRGELSTYVLVTDSTGFHPLFWKTDRKNP